MNQANSIPANKAQDITTNTVGAKMFIAKLFIKENRKQLNTTSRSLKYGKSSLQILYMKGHACRVSYRRTWTLEWQVSGGRMGKTRNRLIPT